MTDKQKFMDLFTKSKKLQKTLLNTSSYTNSFYDKEMAEFKSIISQMKAIQSKGIMNSYLLPRVMGMGIVEDEEVSGRGAKGQKRAKRPGSGANNRWLQHCRAYHASNPHLKYAEVLQEARASYKKNDVKGGFVMGLQVPGMKDSDWDSE